MRTDASIRELKGVGPKAAEVLAKKEIFTVGDLLCFYPSGYDHFEDPVQLSQAETGALHTLRLRILDSGTTVRRGGRTITSLSAADRTGRVRLVFFNMPYVRQTLKAGAVFLFRGILRQTREGTLFMDQPWFADPARYEKLRGTLQPRYPVLRGIGPDRMRKLISAALEAAEGTADGLPAKILTEYGLEERAAALRGIHFPADPDSLQQAKKRLIFDEFFSFILSVRRQRAGEEERRDPRPMKGGALRETEEGNGRGCSGLSDRCSGGALGQPEEGSGQKGSGLPASGPEGTEDSPRSGRFSQGLNASGPEGPIPEQRDWCGRLVQSLPFSLTAEQGRAWEEIRADLTGGYIMNRLLQGDVGSGKTILAFLALVLCAENGRQGALMAPTEVLARQHMEGFKDYMEKSGLPVLAVLLTGSVQGQARREALEAVADGRAQVVIGTHALFQEAVRFRDLGLVVTDEQHRFGVRQRADLAAKGADVHVLVMSATPIPRTLAIVLYGELQVSSLRALPPGRQPVRSLALSDTRRGQAYRFILSEIAKGRQCYVICPAVEEGETQEIENVADYTEKLRRTLPGHIRIDSMTGRLRPEEKNAVMARFSSGGADILVSTTVIEVGINVPNATVILIENAERFGLSQLHQLRGRVGRGTDQSYCIFLYSGRRKPERLEILEKNADGFSIAEQDLKTRGPGDLSGVRQSGLPAFRLADIYEDADLLEAAAACADRILREDPEFCYAGEVRAGGFSGIL